MILRIAQLCAAITCALALTGAGAWAAGIASAPPSAPQPAQRIGVFGDSLADGLWIGLTRAFRNESRVEDVAQLSEVSTGMANWVYRDIGEKTAGQLAEERYDVAVVLFGTNDIQGIRDDAGGVHRFRSPGWERVYRQRVDTIITQLQAHGAVVYWVGLPVMRSSRYDANVRYLNGIFEERAAALGATFVDTRAAVAGADGGYAAYLPDRAGVDRLVRADDGIHFTLPGYVRLAAPVVAAIEEGWRNPPPPPPTPEEERAERLGLVDWSINDEPHVCLRPDILADLLERAEAADRAGPAAQ